MKIAIITLAGIAAALTPALATAQTRTVTTHTVVRTHTGPAAHRTRQVCSVTHRHGRSVRTCRTVRY